MRLGFMEAFELSNSIIRSSSTFLFPIISAFKSEQTFFLP